MGRINVLEKHVAELIAAGEVVERPSSVIKELVENAIDAGAKAITVEIKNGGVTYMRVTDDGCGIMQEDIRKAFMKNATSKILRQDDLESICTLGFRGEALSSVCAVAKVELITKEASEESGTRYIIEGGDEVLFEEYGCSGGTTILVRDLFYNVPARLKFLKKDVSEGNSISKLLDRIALSHPDVKFKLIRDGKEVLNTPGDGKTESAIYAVYGKEFTTSLIPIDYELNGLNVTGFISKPTQAKPTRNMQHFFINGRYVRTKTAMAALEEAFKGSIMVQKFPACVLYITIPFDTIDVNVHPSKMEVRFVDEKPIFQLVFHGVKSAFLQYEQKFSVKNTSSLSAFLDEGHNGAESNTDSITFATRAMQRQGDVRELSWPPVSNEQGEVFNNNVKWNNWNASSHASNAQTVSLDGEDGGSFQKNIATPFVEAENDHLSDSADLLKPNNSTDISEKVEAQETDRIDFLRYQDNSLNTNTSDDEPEIFIPRRSLDFKPNDGDNIKNIALTQNNFSAEAALANKSFAKQNLNIEDSQPLILKEPRTNKENFNEQLYLGEIITIGDYDAFATRPVASKKNDNSEDSTNLPLGESENHAEVEFSQNSNIQQLNLNGSSVAGNTYKLIGEIFSTYFVVELNKNELLFIDKHAAHERLIYERLKKENPENYSQVLLEPIIVNLDKDEYDAVLNNKEVFHQAGFELDDFGVGSIIIRTAPMLLDNKDVKSIVAEMSGYILEHRKNINSSYVEWLYENVACRSAIKAGKSCGTEEMLALIKDLEKENVRYCPHGRPIFVNIKKNELEKKFFRV